MSDDIFERITLKYNHLTNAEQRIADYVLEYRHVMKPMTIAEVANACNVSKSSVTRFCRSVGQNNFAGLKWSISAALAASAGLGEKDGLDVYDEIRAEDSIPQKCQKLHYIGTQALAQALDRIDPEAIDSAVMLLCQAENVYCFGQGNSSIVASDAWGRFTAVTAKFHWIDNIHMQLYTACLLEPKDAVLYFSFSGATRELIQTGKLIRKTNAKLILVTRFPNSPGARYADVILLCGVGETPKQQGSIAAKIGQLFLIDILFNEFCARNPDMVLTNREKTLEAIALTRD